VAIKVIVELRAKPGRRAELMSLLERVAELGECSHRRLCTPAGDACRAIQSDGHQAAASTIERSPVLTG
jgi:hypothetical protein